MAAIWCPSEKRHHQYHKKPLRAEESDKWQKQEKFRGIGHQEMKLQITNGKAH